MNKKKDSRLFEKKWYELAIRGARLAVWEYDIASKQLIIPDGENSTFAMERYGFTCNTIENVPESMLRLGLTDEDRAAFLHLYDEVFAGKKYATADIWFRRTPEDEPSCERITYYVVRGEDRKPVRAYGVGSDITPQKQEELRFHNSIQSILSANPESLCTFQLNLSRDLCFEGHGVSSFILRSLQSDTASGLFENCREMIPFQEDRDQFLTVFDRQKLLDAFASGVRNPHLDYHRKDENGKIFWVRTFLNMLKNPDSGDIEGIIYSLDISREKQQEDIFNILADKEYDLIALLHLDTGTVEAIHLSPSLLSEYRRTFEKAGSVADFVTMRENGASAWVAPEDREKYLKGTDAGLIRRKLDETGSYELTVRGNAAGHGTVYRKLQHYYLNELKKEVLIIDSDVTQLCLLQQKELETEKRLRLQATAANEAKSEFLSRMSHDMRTPLNGIIGITYLLNEMDLPEKAYESLRKIDTSSKFLLGLINDVLDMTKAEKHKIELHPEPYLAKEFYDYLDAVIRPLCQEKSQAFLVSMEPPTDRVPLYDKLRFNQILFNLLSNAVKYTPEGGTIEYRVTFGVPDSGGRMPVHIRISDNGIGMSKDFQKILFDPFSQENRSDASVNRGTGLGLSIVKQLVEAMGGSISVKSEIGRGTAFFIDMDIDTIPAASLAPPSPVMTGQTISLGGRHVLLCEDHPLNQEIAKTLLSEKGMLVEIADNGQRGTELFAKSNVGFYDIILMDLRMPVMDGYEATAAIRALPRPDARTVPIIAMTADAFRDDVKKCLNAGMNGHIAKPINPTSLYRTISDFLRKVSLQ